MFRLKSQISIAGTTFNAVVGVDISSSWDQFTDTCVIRVPNKFSRNNEPITVGDAGFFKRGDDVEVKLQYFKPGVDMPTEFIGKISKISVDNVVMIECDDLMFDLKQKPITKTFRNATVADVVSFITDLETDVVDAKIGDLRITNSTPIMVLEKIKKQFGLRSFIRNGKLIVGFPYIDAFVPTHKFVFEENIIGNSLEYINKDDLRIKVKAVSMQPDNKKLEVETGDPDGEQRTIFAYNITSTSELKKYANEEIDRLKFDGYRGTFTTFGEPSVAHGDKVELISRKKELDERTGVYFVKRVDKPFGLSGYRQIITLDRKAQT